MQEIINLTKDLMRFKTVHAKPREIQRCADFIQSRLQAWDIEYQRLDHENIPSILVLPQKGYAPILLMTHIDVVDAPSELFEPLEKDQKLYGRGSLDDKYAVGLSMVLLKKHLKRMRMLGKGQKDLPFGLLITGDEELGGFNGAKKAIKQAQTDFCIVLDGGGLKKIVVKEKGVVRIKLVSKSWAAAGERTGSGENAIEMLIDDFVKLRTYFVKSAPEHPHRALILKGIQAESNHRIPQSAEALLEIRYAATDDIEQLFEKLQTEFNSKFVVESIEPLFSSGESPHLNLLLDIAKETRIGFEDGANDSRFLAKRGIKGIVWGADGDRSRHSENEHVDIESVYELYGLLDQFMQQSASQLPPLKGVA